MTITFDGLALAAGGGRGAYQAGALLRLAEAGLRFPAVAGSSVGALNGAFLAQGDGSPAELQRLCAFWRALPAAGLVRLQPSTCLAAAALLPASGAVGALLGLLAAGRLALLDPAPLARVLDRALDYRRLCASPTTLVVALLAERQAGLDLLTGPWRAATYLEARRLDPAALRAALLAAAAIPLFFPARRVGGGRYADAGLADPLPARALHGRGARAIVSVFLSDLPAQNRLDFPGATLLQIRPSQPIGADPWSILDFSAASIERLIDLGYFDAGQALDEIAALAGELTTLRARGLVNQALAEGLRVPGRRPPR